MAGTTPRIAVIFYSATGTVAALADAVAEGAAAEGAATRVRAVAERAPREAIEANPRWAQWVDAHAADPTATLDDLAWADGVALGTPTRFGGPSEQLKAFLDTTGGLWARGVLAEKVGTAFTAASTGHGGLESTILAINNVFYHWGTLVLPLGYAADPGLKESGNPYGASFVARGGAPPDDPAVRAARVQGGRLARVARALRADAGA